MTINEEKNNEEMKELEENGQEQNGINKSLLQIANALNIVNQRLNNMDLVMKQLNANIQLLAKNIDINEKQINLAFREIESIEKKL